ncbi:hypothetical protein IFT48_01345 [Pseudomonas fluorescens]|uniref:hypothetical protein n=1 Tax=Pseudomonas TaxID=286 RepID=UPI000F0268FC|nr:MULTISPECIES: hypothetical protein [Pseudomonas]MBD8088619.1 hypothetical protein [Pseudomonas fluorescens]
MKLSKLLMTIALSTFSIWASAENIYREGTKGYELATYAKTVLPASVTPYFIMAKDKSFFYGQIDQSKRTDVLSGESQSALQAANVNVNSRAVAFAKYELSLPEGAARNVCKVVFVDPKRAVVGSTLMHELMHCRIGSAELKNDYRQQISKIVSLDKSIKPGASLSMFEEILARAMSLSYIVNYGIKEDGDFFQRRMDLPYPSNPGPSAMPRVLHLCLEKGACSVEAGSLAEFLLSDDEFRALLIKDFRANDAFNKKVGFSN